MHSSIHNSQKLEPTQPSSNRQEASKHGERSAGHHSPLESYGQASAPGSGEPGGGNPPAVSH